MMQDLSFGKLENEFHNQQPQPEDLVICFQNQQILLHRAEDNSISFPTVAELAPWTETWKPWFAEGLRYVFRMQEKNYFLWLGDIPEQTYGAYSFEPMRMLRYKGISDLLFGAFTAWHLYIWYRNNRFCGCCGSRTVHDAAERMLRCPDCGNMIFPKICPAVIVGVTNGDHILLTKYSGRAYKNYALIAGFIEIGETAEETVRREVFEEAGVHVKNIRYWNTQPWGIESDLLLGYFADLDGSAEITMDREELSLAGWYHRDEMDIPADDVSLTNDMIRAFIENRHPR